MANIVCSLSLGTHGASALVLKAVKKEWKLVAGGMRHLPPESSSEKVGPVLRDFLKSLKAPDAPMVLSLPKRRAILRSVTLPTADPVELAQMARFEAERHIPFNAERYCIDYHLMRSKGVEGSDVILCAADGPVVQQGLDVIQEAGLRPFGVTVSSVSLVNALLACKDRDWVNGKNLMLLNAGLDSLDIVLLQHGQIAYARSAALGLRGVLEKNLGLHDNITLDEHRPDIERLHVSAKMLDCQGYEPQRQVGADQADVGLVMDEVLTELHRTYMYAQREVKFPSLEHIVVCGEGTFLKHFDTVLAQRVGVEVSTINPAGELDGAAEHKLPFEGRGLTLALGAALGTSLEKAYRIDLTPLPYYQRVQKKRLLKRMAVTGVLGLLAAGMATGASLTYQGNRQQLYQDYHAINEKISPQVSGLKEMQLKTKIISRFLEDPNSALTVLDSIASARGLPKMVTLTDVQFEKGKSVVIKGDAQTLRDINDFIADLRGTDHFANINTDNQTPTTLLGNNIYNFTLTCLLDEKGNANKETGR